MIQGASPSAPLFAAAPLVTRRARSSPRSRRRFGAFGRGRIRQLPPVGDRPLAASPADKASERDPGFRFLAAGKQEEWASAGSRNLGTAMVWTIASTPQSGNGRPAGGLLRACPGKPGCRLLVMTGRHDWAIVPAACAATVRDGWPEHPRTVRPFSPSGGWYYCAVQPPSIDSGVPVIVAAASEHRNTAR